MSVAVARYCCTAPRTISLRFELICSNTRYTVFLVNTVVFFSCLRHVEFTGDREATSIATDIERDLVELRQLLVAVLVLVLVLALTFTLVVLMTNIPHVNGR